MDIKDLKHVVGEVREAQPAYIRFYGYVDEYSTRQFNDEFLWLQDTIKPSKIIVGINSEGGSVLHGMGTFSLIQNCPIEVETIVEGLAASMGSVLWAAGTRSYMRDYSLLMIHNPFVSAKAGEVSPNQAQVISAFRQQLETIYHKRLGLSKAKVREIMDGKEGCDGTYFDATAAVKAGLIPADHIIKTPKQIHAKVKNQIEGLTEADSIREIMASVNKDLEDFKPLLDSDPIPNQNQLKTNTKTMNEHENVFASVCAQLGVQEGSDVTTRIAALINAETRLAEVTNAFNELKIQKEGSDAQLANVTNQLNEATTELNAYKDAERAQREAEITTFVENAIADGKIGEESKSKWIEMAQSNYEMVQATLNSIPARDNISKEIANDEANVEAAETGMTDMERAMAAKVEAVVGKDFQFKKISE